MRAQQLNRRTLDDKEKEQFAHEVALGYFDDEGLSVRFQLPPHRVTEYKRSGEIRQKVIMKQREIDQSDQAIRIHARRAARVAIAGLIDIIEDKDAPAKTKMEAGRQLREYATVVDKEAIERSKNSEGAIYIHTNLDLGEGKGVYAVTAREVNKQMSEPNPDDDFSDLLGASTDE